MMHLPEVKHESRSRRMVAENGQPNLLNAELYARDPDHSEYADVATELVLQQHGDVPTLARDTALNHLRDVAAKTSVSEHFARWETGIDEAFRTAFLIARAEDWSDLDPERIEELIEASYAATNSMREAVGSDQVDRSDFNTWLSILLLGYVHEADEWQPLIQYIESRSWLERHRPHRLVK